MGNPRCCKGNAYTEDTLICINDPLGYSGVGKHANKYLLTKEMDFVFEKEIETAPQPRDKEWTMIIIGDEERIEMKYIVDKFIVGL